MSLSKFPFYETRSSTNLRQTVSAIDMVDGALDKLGLGLLKTTVDDMCGTLKFWVDAIEMSKETCFWNFSQKFENNNFKLSWFWHFSRVWACLKVDLERYMCDIDMVDGALE